MTLIFVSCLHFVSTNESTHDLPNFVGMVWYFSYPHYTNECRTRLKVNVQNKYKSIHIKT